MTSTLYDIADPHFGGPPSRRPITYVFPLCIGLVAGFVSFGVFFGLQMMYLNDHVYARHNETLYLLKNRLVGAIQEKDACLEDDTMAVRVGTLQGKLMDHQALSERFESLMKELESVRGSLDAANAETLKHEESLKEKTRNAAMQAYERHKLTQENEGYKASEARFIEQNRELNRQYQEQTDIVAKQVSEMNDIKQEREQYKASKARLIEENRQLTTKLGEQTDITAKQTSEMNVIIQEREQHKASEARLVEENRQLNIKLGEQTDTIAKQTSETNVIKQELEQQKASEARLVEEHRQLNIKFGEQTDTIAKQTSELTDVTRERELYKASEARLVEEHRQLNMKYAEQADIIARQASEMNVIKQEREQYKESEARVTIELTTKYQELATSVSELTMKGIKDKKDIDGLTEKIRKRENFLCRDEYGDGPYYVEVSPVLTDHIEADFRFIIELASRHDLPHSVFTFLSLVRYELLDGSTFLPIDDEDAFHIERYDPEEGEEGVESFEVQLDAVGLGRPVLAVSEVTTSFPCEEGSLRFDDDFGPGLVLHLSPVPDRNCFGKVVRGLENLRTIQERLSYGHEVEHVSFQVLDV